MPPARNKLTFLHPNQHHLELEIALELELELETELERQGTEFWERREEEAERES